MATPIFGHLPPPSPSSPHKTSTTSSNPSPQHQLLHLLQAAALRHPDVLDAITPPFGSSSSAASPEKPSPTPFAASSPPSVIFNKSTGRSKGYGFVTFKHIDGAVLALKEPSKRIDGRMTVTQLASAGASNNDGDVWGRKIFVGNVPFEISSERLLNHFQSYGEVEEGPLGFDKGGGKTRVFAFFVYRTEEDAKASLIEPIKMIDGYQVHCKFAVDHKKGKSATQSPMPTTAAASSRFSGDGMSGQKQQQQSSLPAPPMMAPQYGGYGGVHPTLPENNYRMQPLVPSFGNSDGGGGGGGYGRGIGPFFSDFGGRFPPPNSAGMPPWGFTDGSAHQQPMPIPRPLPSGIFHGMSPYS